ncbi:tetratricopeptide repeat protein [Actinomadura nitritigenes]|uniref:tetratricopeptide repeat protein n=1 Tax=Actinomadura nitritigenes TaxID=134602 RepID=UPI003D8DFD6A
MINKRQAFAATACRHRRRVRPIRLINIGTDDLPLLTIFDRKGRVQCVIFGSECGPSARSSRPFRGPGPAAPGSGGGPAAAAPEGVIARYQQTLRRTPGDYSAWAALGAAYVQQARITVNPDFYPKAEGALRRSLTLNTTDNYQAMIGMAALANARHEFAAAVGWGKRAGRIAPSNPDLYGTLNDAYTQLGDYPAATAAVARMNDLGPGVAAFTRASYELEMHGHAAAASRVLRQALESAYVPSDVAYCRYYLGELALYTGDLDEAARQYQAARTADPN